MRNTPLYAFVLILIFSFLSAFADSDDEQKPESSSRSSSYESFGFNSDGEDQMEEIDLNGHGEDPTKSNPNEGKTPSLAPVSPSTRNPEKRNLPPERKKNEYFFGSMPSVNYPDQSAYFLGGPLCSIL